MLSALRVENILSHTSSVPCTLPVSNCETCFSESPVSLASCDCDQWRRASPTRAHSMNAAWTALIPPSNSVQPFPMSGLGRSSDRNATRRLESRIGTWRDPGYKVSVDARRTPAAFRRAHVDNRRLLLVRPSRGIGHRLPNYETRIGLVPSFRFQRGQPTSPAVFQ